MEAYCHYPISEAKELLYTTRPGFVVIQTVASISKYATAMYISTNRSQVEPTTLLAHDNDPKSLFPKGGQFGIQRSFSKSACLITNQSKTWP